MFCRGKVDTGFYSIFVTIFIACLSISRSRFTNKVEQKRDFNKKTTVQGFNSFSFCLINFYSAENAASCWVAWFRVVFFQLGRSWAQGEAGQWY